MVDHLEQAVTQYHPRGVLRGGCILCGELLFVALGQHFENDLLVLRKQLLGLRNAADRGQLLGGGQHLLRR